MGLQPTHLFVYGTLCATFTNPAAVQLRQYSRYVGEGTMPGLLYDLGDYPGAVYLPNGQTLVHGSIYALTNESDTLLVTLDTYEGISTPPDLTDEYRREAVPVAVTGRDVDCWVYLYNQAIINQYRIDSGDYVRYVSQ